MDPVAEQLDEAQPDGVRRGPLARQRVAETIAAAALVAVCALMWALAPAGESPDWLVLVGVVGLYAVLWQVTFEIGSGATTPVQLAFVPMWFVVEPALLPLVVAASQILGNLLAALRDRQHHHWRRVLIGLPDAWHAVGPAVVLAAFGTSQASFDITGVFLLALAAQFACDGASGVLRVWAVSGERPSVPHATFAWTWIVDLALAPIGLILAVAMGTSEWSLLAAIPLAALLAEFAKERDDRILKAMELSHAYRGTAQLMGDVLEADDAYTGGEHTHGVVELSLAVGRVLELDPSAMRNLEFGALLHDVGKLRVSNDIINKPGKLNAEEWEIIKQHPLYGQEMLDRVGGALSEAGPIVRGHHERWDGDGYPDGLVGASIPLGARIITVCDSFSAMTTNRSYRRGMSRAEAMDEIDRCSGSQFDPHVVAALKAALVAFPPPLFGLAPGEQDCHSEPGVDAGAELVVSPVSVRLIGIS